MSLKSHAPPTDTPSLYASTCFIQKYPGGQCSAREEEHRVNHHIPGEHYPSPVGNPDSSPVHERSAGYPPHFSPKILYQNDSEWPEMDFKHNFKKSNIWSAGPPHDNICYTFFEGFPRPKSKIPKYPVYPSSIEYISVRDWVIKSVRKW